MANLAVILAALAVFAMAYAVLSVVFSEERQVSRRLRGLSDYERAQAATIEPLTQPFRQRVVGPAGRGIVGFARRFTPRDYWERIDAMLVRAGRPRGLDADTFLALKFVALFLVGALVFVASLVLGLGLLRAILLAGLLGLGTFFFFDMWLSSRVTERKTEIRRALPDMLDMMMISVEAGLGFSAAVDKYVRNTKGPLAQEFATALAEMRAGLSRREALRNLADRCDVPELNSFVMAMVQADVFGIAVSDVLHTQSREMRVKRRQFAEERAQKAPAKMVFPLILCILPATLIVLAGPAVYNIGRLFGRL